MLMTAGPRKFALTAHVTASVGWLGAVSAFLAGLKSQDIDMVRAAYLGMQLTTWSVIFPLAFASLATGLVVSVGTQWGLFRHYWIVAKLVISVLATMLLLLHTQPIGHLAEAVRHATLVGGELGGLRVQLVANAALAVLALIVATTLGVYKPLGMTPYGRRKQRETVVTPDREMNTSTPRWIYVCSIIAAGLVLLVVVLHLTGHSLGSH